MRRLRQVLLGGHVNGRLGAFGLTPLPRHRAGIQRVVQDRVLRVHAGCIDVVDECTFMGPFQGGVM